MFADICFLCFENRGVLHLGSAICSTVGGENAFQSAGPCFKHFVHANGFIVYLKDTLIVDAAYLAGNCGQGAAVHNFYNDSPVFLFKQLLNGDVAVECHTQSVAESHLAHSFGNATESHSVG